MQLRSVQCEHTPYGKKLKSMGYVADAFANGEIGNLYGHGIGVRGDVVRQEGKDGTRVIAESADFLAVAPYAPRFPFETWILPKRHQSRFEDSPRHEYAALGRLLGDILRRMNRALRFPPYNLLIHSAPLSEPANEFYHWHVEVMPKLTRVAGFEWGTGFYINPTSPDVRQHRVERRP